MRTRPFVIILGIATMALMSAHAQSDLRIIPYPKSIAVEPGAFAIEKGVVFTAPERSLWLVGPMVRDECAHAGLPQPALASCESKKGLFTATLGNAKPLDLKSLREKPSAEEYVLQAQADGVSIAAATEQGLFYGIQTLCQLIRANRTGANIPCAKIHDWPCDLKIRAYQDDLTRIPSSTFDQLRREVDLGAYFKLNVFTYYMESQFAFKKNPVIGPTDGSLTPDELKVLVSYAKPRQIDILGNQQSFGHMESILSHDEYKPLAETGWILNPTNPDTYKLLDDLYSEIAPLLPFPYFNVCCDETQGLGTGPAKAECDKVGVGTVYARHIVELHKLIAKKYHKRMMMWGDIVLQHPDTLNMIPKDTIMLTWGYEPNEKFDDQILPFTKAGYDFIVCPSVRNYGRIMPDFSNAAINIQNFTRDGVKYGALGVINTAWDDGGRTLNAVNWHGIAWGAECAWNGGTTSIDDFNRRIGAVLFGESGDHFGKAIDALAGLQKLNLTAGGSDTRFWQDPLAGQIKPEVFTAEQEDAKKSREMALASGPEFALCQREARVNGDLLDYYVHGVQRYVQEADAVQKLSDVVATYKAASEQANANKNDALAHCKTLIEQLANGYKTLQQNERNLYLRENKPYGVEIRYQWYQGFIDRYTALAQRLEAARADVAAGKPMPSAKDIGLVVDGSAVK